MDRSPRRAVILLPLLAVLAGPGGAAACLVAHLPLDDAAGSRASDRSGRGHAGRLLGGPAWGPGLAGGALSFSDGAQRVLVPDAPELDLRGGATLAAWVRPARRGTQTVLAKALHGEVDGYALQLSSGGAVFARFNQATRGNDHRVSSKRSYPDDGSTWLHVAATFDGSQIRLYLDGAPERRRPAPELRIRSNDLDLAIGAHPDGSHPLEGAVDDVRVYDCALSELEIRSLVRSTRPRDRDGDAVADDRDAFPDDPLEWADHDGDGTGDDADLDDDGDGMPDGWELANGLDPRDPRDATADADGDGASNLEEFRSRGDPRGRAGTPPARAARATERPPGFETWAPRPLAPRAARVGTGEKPQSKVWTHHGRWWAVFPDHRGTWIWRRDADQWTRVLKLSPSTRAKADYALADDGALVHVLLHDELTATKLASAEYVAGFPGSYRPWRRRPHRVALPFDLPPETATLALDGAERLWVAYDALGTVRVRHAAAADAYASWSPPQVLASDLHEDDIGAIAAFGGRLGVMWSNSRTRRFGFRHRADADPVGAWSPAESPGAASARDAGGGFADDHINFAVGSDGTLYAAVKTSYDAPELPVIGVLVRRPSGVWDPFHPVDGHGTRPIAVLNERAGELVVIFTSDAEGGRIVYRSADLATLSFGKRRTLIDGRGLNDASSTKQPFAGELVVIASTRDATPKVLGVSIAPTLPARADR